MTEFTIVITIIVQYLDHSVAVEWFHKHQEEEMDDCGDEGPCPSNVATMSVGSLLFHDIQPETVQFLHN